MRQQACASGETLTRAVGRSFRLRLLPRSPAQSVLLLFVTIIRSAMSQGQPFVVHDRVRWADVDHVRIMRFSAFTRLVEVAEQELMRAAGMPYGDIFDAPTLWMPRRHLAIEYFAPARLDDAVSLVTFVSRLGDTSATINVDVRSMGRHTLIAAAAMVVVCVSVDTFRKQALPAAFRDALAPFHCSVDAARAGAPESR